MALIRWEPLRDMDRFFDDDFFSRSLRENLQSIGWDLAVDVYDDGKGSVIAETNIPGIDPENIRVSIEDGYLRLSGSREEKTENKNQNYYSKEIKRGSFERTIRLPAVVDENNTEATYEDGVLKITMPKIEEKKLKEIKIQRKKNKK